MKIAVRLRTGIPWGQHCGAAAELPLGAELYVLAGSARVPMALRAPDMNEDAARESRNPVAPAILSPVFLSNPSRVVNAAFITVIS
jgi:hypothetical protein